MDWTAVTAIIGCLGGWECVKWVLNRKANRRISNAEAASSEADTAERISKLFEGRIEESRNSLSLANVTIESNQQRMGHMNDTIDKLIDENRELRGQVWNSQQECNRVNNRLTLEQEKNTELERALGKERLRSAHFESWHCRVAECEQRIPPNPTLRGRTYAEPEGDPRPHASVPQGCE